jgi:hypothetical protein
MSKKHYNIFLSRELAARFDQVVNRRRGAKSALIEAALKAALDPEQHLGVQEALARRLNDLNRIVGRIERDVAIATETLALFVRYFLTITPPLPQSEQEAARLLGKERFHVFVTQVGRRIAEDNRLASEVLQTIATNDPDLFTTDVVGASTKAKAEQPSGTASCENASPDTETPKTEMHEDQSYA